MTQTVPSAELQVEGEPGVFWCARHKNVKTRLRCGRCETPICPKCTVMGPTGARCRDCGSNRSSHMYQVRPWHLAATFAATLLMSAVGAVLVNLVGLYLLFFAPVVGTIVGKVVTFVTRGKRGPVLTWAATAGATAGVMLVVLPAVLHYFRAASVLSTTAAGDAPDVFAPVVSTIVFPLIFLGLVISSLWYWLR